MKKTNTKHSKINSIKNKKPIAVLGGGVSGLAAALELLESGQRVVLVEESKFLGGAAASTKIPENREVAIGYHQIVGSDKKLIEILSKLGLLSQVKWKNINISTICEGKNINLASPVDMIQFKRMPFISRIRYMLMGVRCLMTHEWSAWKNKNVTEFVNTWADKKVLAEIFEPLVNIKFGFSADQGDAAWLGYRLSHSEGKTPFGYIPNTNWTHELIEKMRANIEYLGGVIKLGKSVRILKIDEFGVVSSVTLEGGEVIGVKGVINTIPPSALYPILEDSSAPGSWLKVIKRIKYISCYSLLMGLPFVPFKDYWTIFLHPRRIFGGCFNISHLNDTLVTRKDKSIINLFTNLAYGRRPWSFKKYVDLAIKDLQQATGKKVKPNWVQINIIKFVSPVFSVGYKNPKSKLGKNFYLAGIYRTYPKFSSTGEAIANGIETAKEFLKGVK